MNKVKYCITSLLFLFGAVMLAQDQEVSKEREPGHLNQSKFKQLHEEFATPNTYRSASGAPGPDYYQQQANYVMNIELDDENHRIYGEETITYINNSPDDLEFLCRFSQHSGFPDIMGQWFLNIHMFAHCHGLIGGHRMIVVWCRNRNRINIVFLLFKHFPKIVIVAGLGERLA